MKVANATGRLGQGVGSHDSPLAAERIGTRLDLYEGFFMVSGTVRYPDGMVVQEWFGPKFDDRREADAWIEARSGALPDDVHVSWCESYVPSKPGEAPRTGLDVLERQEPLPLADRVALYGYARALMVGGVPT